MSRRLLRVELLVCPEPSCQQIGKRPNNGPSLKGCCTGGAANPHKKRRMEPVRFVEDRA